MHTEMLTINYVNPAQGNRWPSLKMSDGNIYSIPHTEYANFVGSENMSGSLEYTTVVRNGREYRNAIGWCGRQFGGGGSTQSEGLRSNHFPTNPSGNGAATPPPSIPQANAFAMVMAAVLRAGLVTNMDSFHEWARRVRTEVET